MVAGRLAWSSVALLGANSRYFGSMEPYSVVYSTLQVPVDVILEGWLELDVAVADFLDLGFAAAAAAPADVAPVADAVAAAADFRIG